jgi:DNA invertase Pin-like site-specific DNA recombinase
MTTAAVYLRISQDSTGEAEGVERQRADCVRVVAARAYDVVGYFTDNDISAAGKKQRPAFNDMVEAIEAGKVDVVVAQRWDRLSRNRRDDLRLLEACEKHNVMLSFSRGGDLDLETPMGSMIADVLASQARNEIRIKGDRQRLAQKQRAEKGKPAKGIRPTGYTLDGEVIPAEAQIIGRIFDRFSAGDTLKGIAAGLEADGITTRRGGRWTSSSVSSILRNARYAGRSVYKGEDVGPATWEAIVPESQFAAVQARLDDPRRKTRGESTARKHLGSGLYFCSCGLRVHSSSGLGAGMNRYTCRHTCFYRSGKPVDDFVLAVIRGRLALPDLRDLLARPVDEAEMASLSAERNDIRNRLATFEADYDAGLIDGRRLKAATDKASARLEEIRRAEAKLVAQSGPDSVLGAENPVEAFDAAPLAMQREVIDTLARISLKKGKHGSRTFDPETVEIAWR